MVIWHCKYQPYDDDYDDNNDDDSNTNDFSEQKKMYKPTTTWPLKVFIYTYVFLKFFHLKKAF